MFDVNLKNKNDNNNNSKNTKDKKKKSQFISVACIRSLHIPKNGLLYSYTSITTVIIYKLILEKILNKKNYFLI